MPLTAQGRNGVFCSAFLTMRLTCVCFFFVFPFRRTRGFSVVFHPGIFSCSCTKDTFITANTIPLYQTCIRTAGIDSWTENCRRFKKKKTELTRKRVPGKNKNCKSYLVQLMNYTTTGTWYTPWHFLGWYCTGNQEKYKAKKPADKESIKYTTVWVE